MKISKFQNLKVMFWGALLGVYSLILVVGISSVMPEGGVLIVLLIPEALLIWRFVVNLRRYRSPEYRQIQKRNRAEYKAGAADRKRERAEAAERKQEQERRDRTPVSVVLISTVDEYGKSVTGTAARAALGYALFGAFGAAVGMTTAKTKVKGQKATFSVKYESGRTGTETVEVGSKRFKELAELLVK